jgi:phage terminase Nu1 subunit (DNA packaging protein)
MAASAFTAVSRADMARLLGVSYRTFSDLETRGTVVPVKQGRGAKPLYDVRVTIQQYLAYKLRETPRDRLFKLQADRVEIENRRRRNELLDAIEVDKEWAEIATATKRAVMALPGRLLQLGLIGTGKLAAVTEACTDALRHVEAAG